MQKTIQMGELLPLLPKCCSDLCRERGRVSDCCNSRHLRGDLQRALALVSVELKEEENLGGGRKMLALSLCSVPKPHCHHPPLSLGARDSLDRVPFSGDPDKPNSLGSGGLSAEAASGIQIYRSKDLRLTAQELSSQVLQKLICA